jgi:two-component system LytT family response regulator
VSKIRAIIVDDEESARDVLDNLLRRFCPDVEVLNKCSNVPQAVEACEKENPDLVFLDIEMPNYAGFEIVNFFESVPFEIIFVTAYDKYALRAFEISAIDYLLKPVDIDELIRAVEKVKTRITEKNINQRLELFLNQQPQQPAGHAFSKIAVPTLEGLSFYPVEDIICCIAKGTYTQIELVKDKDMLVSSTLKEIEEMLPASIFCRIHHSYLINMNHIKKYYKGKGGYIEMNNGRTMLVSTRKREEFLSRLRH